MTVTPCPREVMAQREAGAHPLRLAIAALQLGCPSERWLLRQIGLLEHTHPMVVTWRDHRDAMDAQPSFDVTEVGGVLRPYEGRGRWRFRARHVLDGNYYGCIGRERTTLTRWLRERRPEAVLCHYGHVSLRMLPAALRCGVPLMAHFHGMDASSMLNNPWYRRSLSRWISAFAGIIVVGAHQRTRLVELGAPEDRIRVIPCGVPTDEFTPPREDVDSKRNPHRFIAVSRLVECKGLRYTLEAFARVAHGDPAAELVVIGDGPDRAMLERLAAELGVADAVHFLGVLSARDVRTWLQQSCVFVQHSVDGRRGEREGFGVTVAEASSCGLPVVVSRCGGILDQVVHGETGLLVAQRDTHAMADAMIAMMGDPGLRARLGRAGRRRMIDLFDASGQARKLERFLVEQCTGRRTEVV